MADSAVSAIVALAKAGIEACRTAKEYQEEAARLGKRLTIVVASMHEWKELYSKGKVHNIQQFHDAVENVFLCMQAASLGRKQSWTKRIKKVVLSQDLLDSIRSAEQQLNTVITDLHIEQSNAIFNRLDDLSKGVAALLDQFAASPSKDDPSVSLQQQFDLNLRQCQEQTPEISFSNDVPGSFIGPAPTPTKKLDNEEELRRAAIAAVLSGGGGHGSSSTGTNGHSLPSTSKPDSEFVQPPASHKVQFEPSPADLKAISLDSSQLVFRDDKSSLLGGGGFAEVFRGTYKGKPVAIKRLKADAQDIRSLSKEQISHDIRSLTNEALMMKHCSTHCNIIQVFGCISKLNQVARPLIVMELMRTTLFDAVHGGSLELSYSHLLYLLKGVVGALEFLHLQGIVHHDVKSLNVMLNEDLSMAKLSDFGEAKVKGLNTTKLRLSTIIGTTTSRPDAGAFLAGTVAYQAPEILSEAVHETSRVSEMYSFGVLTWECLERKIPHKGKKESSITILALKKMNIPMLTVSQWPREDLTSMDAKAWRAMQEVASACLSRDRSARLTSSVVVALWHKVPDPVIVARPAITKIPESAQFEEEIQVHTQATQYDEELQVHMQSMTNYAPDKFQSQSQSSRPSKQQSCLKRHWKWLLVLAVVCVGGIIGAVVAVVASASGDGSTLPTASVAVPAVVMSCPGGHEFEYYYEFCASPTAIQIVRGNCTADGRKEEELLNFGECMSITENNAMNNCVQCGNNKAVCSDSSDAGAVCPQVESNGCNAVDYSFYAYPCVNDEDYDILLTTCRNGIESVQSEVTSPCSQWGRGSFCYNCEGLDVCSSLEGATCAEVLGTTS